MEHRKEKGRRERAGFRTMRIREERKSVQNVFEKVEFKTLETTERRGKGRNISPGEQTPARRDERRRKASNTSPQ